MSGNDVKNVDGLLRCDSKGASPESRPEKGSPLSKTFHVYLLSSRSRNLYTGVTSDLVARVQQHKTKMYGGHTAKYNIDRLVYFEEFASAAEAIAREKEIKQWRRELRVALIETTNPTWSDLSKDWYDLSAKTDE